VGYLQVQIAPLAATVVDGVTGTGRCQINLAGI
jgi:hypothetical protein